MRWLMMMLSVRLMVDVQTIHLVNDQFRHNDLPFLNTWQANVQMAHTCTRLACCPYASQLKGYIIYRQLTS